METHVVHGTHNKPAKLQNKTPHKCKDNKYTKQPATFSMPLMTITKMVVVSSFFLYTGKKKHTVIKWAFMWYENDTKTSSPIAH